MYSLLPSTASCTDMPSRCPMMCSSVIADSGGPYTAGSSLLTGGNAWRRSMLTGLMPASACLANSSSRSHANLSSATRQENKQKFNDSVSTNNAVQIRIRIVSYRINRIVAMGEAWTSTQ
jgi:hypothetical protein